MPVSRWFVCVHNHCHIVLGGKFPSMVTPRAELDPPASVFRTFQHHKSVSSWLATTCWI